MRRIGVAGTAVAAIALAVHFIPTSVLRTGLVEIVNPQGTVCGRFGFGRGFPSPYGEVGLEMTSGGNWLFVGLAPDAVSFSIEEHPENPGGPVRFPKLRLDMGFLTYGNRAAQLAEGEYFEMLRLSSPKGDSFVYRTGQDGPRLELLDKDGKVIWKAPGE
jgi:hypothetical protein